MTRLAWHPLARMELAEAADFYEGESTGLGQIFVDAVERGVLMVEEHPAAGRKVLGGVRMLLFSRFPYSCAGVVILVAVREADSAIGRHSFAGIVTSVSCNLCKLLPGNSPTAGQIR